MAVNNDPLAGVELTIQLGLAFQVTLTEFIRQVEAAGYDDLRPVHGLVFQALRWSPATSTELATALGVTKQAAGQIIDDLENKGYVARAPHPDGGRKRLVSLTPKAHEHLAVAGRVMHAMEAGIADRLGAARLADLRDALVTVIRTVAGDAVPPLRPVW